MTDIERTLAMPPAIDQAVRTWRATSTSGGLFIESPVEYAARLAVGEAIKAHVAEKVAECQAPPLSAAPAGWSYMERRIDAAGRYVEQINIGPAEAPHTGWIAVVKTDRIGSAEVAFARYAESPSDALDLALADAAAWVQVQKDIR